MTRSNHYRFYNRRPDGKLKEDCVCRAISLGLKLPYKTTEKLINITAQHNKCDALCVCCYHNLLEDVFNLTVKYCKNGETVQDIADMYPNNTVIIRIDSHLTCSVNSIVHDIWDCTNELVDCYWIAR